MTALLESMDQVIMSVGKFLILCSILIKVTKISASLILLDLMYIISLSTSFYGKPAMFVVAVELLYCIVFLLQLVSHNQELMKANLNSQDINEVCTYV